MCLNNGSRAKPKGEGEPGKKREQNAESYNQIKSLRPTKRPEQWRLACRNVQFFLPHCATACNFISPIILKEKGLDSSRNVCFPPENCTHNSFLYGRQREEARRCFCVMLPSSFHSSTVLCCRKTCVIHGGHMQSANWLRERGQPSLSLAEYVCFWHRDVFNFTGCRWT